MIGVDPAAAAADRREQRQSLAGGGGFRVSAPLGAHAGEVHAREAEHRGRAPRRRLAHHLLEALGGSVEAQAVGAGFDGAAAAQRERIIVP